MAMTIATLSASALFLNPKGDDLGKATEALLKFLGSSLGVTKADIGKVSVSGVDLVVFRFSTHAAAA